MTYPLVIPLLGAPALEQREHLVHESMPAEVTVVQLHSTGLVYRIELQGRWVRRATQRRWQRLLEQRVDLFGPISSLTLEGEEGHWNLRATGQPHLSIHVEDDRATLHNPAPFHHEPPEAVIDLEELAASFVGRPYGVTWHCSQPVSVGCGESPANERRTVERRDLSLREHVLGVCSSGNTLELRRVVEIELDVRETKGLGWVARASMGRIAIDAVTGEDVSDRPWLGPYTLQNNPCPQLDAR